MGECWLEFLDGLGVEAIVSEATTGKTITTGAIRADNETCLPVKVFSGHLLSLKDRVDAILIPRVVSQEHGNHSCPKFMGLPDLARALDPDLPPVLAPRMDLGDRRCLWTRDWYVLARSLGGKRISSATSVARFLLDLREHDLRVGTQPEEGDIKVGVAGHLYNVNDHRVSMDLLNRIRGLGAIPVTMEEVHPKQIRAQANTISRRIFWSFESRLAGVVLHWSRTASVSGILFVTSFACGPGSMVGALLEDQLERERLVPLMTITLDEHSAETGLITRIDAFIDMLRHSARATRTGRTAFGAGSANCGGGA